MTFTIEPMLTLGTNEWDMWDDGWTVVTKDQPRTAQFEHTLLVTDDGRRDPHAALAGGWAHLTTAQSAMPVRGADEPAHRHRTGSGSRADATPANPWCSAR